MNPAIKPYDCPNCGEEIFIDHSQPPVEVQCVCCKEQFTVDVDAELVDGDWKDRTSLIPK